MLNDKQERFCREYVIDLNGKQAAIRAGYEFKNETNGYYVYFLINPINGSIFYVGKGKGKRKEAHLREHLNNNLCNFEKHRVIGEILEAGLTHEAVVFENGLTEKDALKLESDLIASLKDCGITNISNGNLDEIEKSKLSAKHWLSKVISYETWVKLKNPTKTEQSMYFGIIEELAEIAKNGCVTTLKFEQ